MENLECVILKPENMRERERDNQGTKSFCINQYGNNTQLGYKS